MDSKKVGKYISKLRKEKGLTQEKLAEKIGVSSKTISKWETGINIPDTNLLFELSKEFNVDVQDILNGEKVSDSKSKGKVFINSINFYNNVFKRKMLLLCILSIVLILSFFSVLYTISNYNKNSLYDITSNNKNYAVEGYLIFNHKESIFIINNISFNSNIVGTNDEPLINQLDVYIKNVNEHFNYYSESKTSDVKRKVSSFVENVSISFAASEKEECFNVNKKNINDFVLVVGFYDNKNIYHEDKISLEMKKHYSNNKIIY